jgi:hypothetical protein
MKEPPYDDALWPLLITFFFYTLFTIGVVVLVYNMTASVITPPPPSTLLRP